MGPEGNYSLQQFMLKRLQDDAIQTQKHSPLLSLPTELLVQVLLFAITIPHHPKNATYMKGALDSLFISTLRTSHRLRQLTLDLIIRQTLWVTVDYRGTKVANTACLLHTQLPILKPQQRSLLPAIPPGIHLSLGRPTVTGPLTRSYTDPANSFIFPYNPHSFGNLYRFTLERDDVFDVIRISLLNVPEAFHTNIDKQVRPVFRIFPDRVLTTIIDYNGDRNTTLSARTRRSGLPRSVEVDNILSCMNELDRRGRPLEASMLALYFSKSLFNDYSFFSDIGDATRSVHLLKEPNYLTSPRFLRRMRVIRTMNYIERRACLAYVSAAYKYGSSFIDTKNGIRHKLIGDRWLRQPIVADYFGLPDHELAETYYINALIYALNESWSSADDMNGEKISRPKRASVNLVLDGDLDGSEMAYQAVRNAYVAWRFHKNNVKYAALFRELVEKYPAASPRLLTIMQGWDRDVPTDFDLDSSEVKAQNSTFPIVYEDVDGQYRVFGGTLDLWRDPVAGHNFQYLHRAVEVAKRADVAYDDRRGAELSSLDYVPCDEVQVLTDLLLDTDGNGRPGTKLNFNNFGITDEDIENYKEHEEPVTALWDKWSFH